MPSGKGREPRTGGEALYGLSKQAHGHVACRLSGGEGKDVQGSSCHCTSLLIFALLHDAPRAVLYSVCIEIKVVLDPFA